MNFGVIVFPGSNCDHDAWYAVEHNLGQKARFIWHDSHHLGDVDAVISARRIFLRRLSALRRDRQIFARHGGGAEVRRRWRSGARHLQRLPDPGGSGLLPGALLRNAGLKFLCQEVKLRTETTNSPFTSEATKGQILRLPIAHGEGCYYADQRTLDELAAEDRIAFRYVDNPNGSLDNIAGVLNRERNVLG